MLKIGILKETTADETRVAATPETVGKMTKAGMEVWVESGAGLRSNIEDTAYEQAGGKITPDRASLFKNSTVIFKVTRPQQEDIEAMNTSTTLVGPLYAMRDADLINRLNAKKITAFALELIPRIARAQSMDMLSSMSNLAGYKSVIMAADRLGRIFPMLTTAAGTIPPAKVIVIGAGVAGLQAIATARRLGGVVLAFDTRPVVAEQVKSLGAEFVSLETTHEQSQDTGGYAKEQTADFYKNEQDIVHRYSKETDVIITTALIPGKKAPILITEAMVKEMKPGSVIVDLAAEQGGNCELTKAGEIIVAHGVTLIGITNMPSTLMVNASQLYARNLLAFLTHIAQPLADNQLDMADEIIKGSLVTYQGEVVHPGVKASLS